MYLSQFVWPPVPERTNKNWQSKIFIWFFLFLLVGCCCCCFFLIKFFSFLACRFVAFSSFFFFKFDQVISFYYYFFLLFSINIIFLISISRSPSTLFLFDKLVRLYFFYIPFELLKNAFNQKSNEKNCVALNDER